MANVLSYMADLSISLIFDNKETVLPKESISGLIIDNNYLTNNMPIMFLNLNVTTNNYNKLIAHKNDGKILLNMRIYTPDSSFKVYKDRIKDQFTYRVPSNYDYKEELQSSNSNVDNSYNNITIGLFSDTLYNFNGKLFNGVLKNVTTEQLLDIVKEDREFITDKYDNSKKYDEFIIPPMSSRSDIIKLIHSKTNFYNCRYIYYNDFDKSYIIKNEDNREPTKENFNTVVFNVDKLDVNSSLYQGIEKDTRNNYYVVYLNGTDIEVKDNDTVSDLIGEIRCIDDDGTINIEKFEDSDSNIDKRVLYIRGDKYDFNIAKKSIQSAKKIINIIKNNIDSSILDLDKSYILHNFNNDYVKYNGKYRIIAKRDVIVNRGSEFNITTTLILLNIDK